MRPSRRELLLGALAVPVLACTKPQPPNTAVNVKITPQRVVIVGAGLAGLATAHMLTKQGHEVRVLEAQPRVGGRILTLRTPFQEGFYVEAGAKHVMADPSLVALIQELNVEVYDPTRLPPLATVALRDGQRTVVPVGQDPPSLEPFNERERAAEFRAQLGMYFDNIDEGDPRTRDWITPVRARLDRVDLAEYLQGKGASLGFQHMLRDAVGMGEPAQRLSALWVMQQAATIRFEMGLARFSGRIKNGTEQLPLALAAKLGDKVKTGAPVTRIAHSHREVEVTFDEAGKSQTLKADRVVIAVHAPILRRLMIEPGLPEQVLTALESLPTSSVVRCWAQLDARVWADAGVSGHAVTDSPLGDLHEEGDLQPKTSGMLSAYFTGDNAREFVKLDPEARKARWLDLIEAAYPGSRSHVIASEIKAWDEDPFAKGAYVYMPTEFMTRHLDALNQPSGRLHFAGDYTSLRPGFMHGALQSAERVAREISGR